MRGHRIDYDLWAKDFDLTDWDFKNCLPYFIAGENHKTLNNSWRGKRGRLEVKQADYPDPLFDSFLEAGKQSGQGYSEDLNGAKPEGLARLDTTILNGKRCSAATAHLKPALERRNLTLITLAQTNKILINKKNAEGVVFTHASGTFTAYAQQEVLLCCGAINSPTLLMKSGIGPEKHLQECNITTQLNVPGVGKNLQDHAKIRLQFASKKYLPFHAINKPINKIRSGLIWMLTGRGLASSNIWEAGGFIRSHDHLEYPNLQYHFGPLGFSIKNGKIKVEQAFSLNVDQMRPKSTGYIKLNSSAVNDHPIIRFNYMREIHDIREMIGAVKKARDLVSQSAFDEFRGVEMKPGKEFQSDKDIEKMLRANIETAYHPSCTCRMGYDDEAVTDSQFRVHGVNRLRVVDASAMPRIVSANLNAPVQMMAARAADFILKRPQLPQFELQYKI